MSGGFIRGGGFLAGVYTESPNAEPSTTGAVDIEALCARIKAADDAAADNDYMLDSDDCISVLRGTWQGPMLNDRPTLLPRQLPEPSNRDCEHDLSQALETLLTPLPPIMHLNGDKSVAVSNEVFWEEDMTKCPCGVKCQLLGRGGVAIYGQYNGVDPFWIGWAPLPKRRTT